MSLIVVGLDRQNAPLDLLERVTVTEEAVGKTLLSIARRPGLSGNLSEVVVLSTCQRFEVFAVVDRFHEAVDDLKAYLAERAGTSAEELSDLVNVLFDDFAVVHLFEVAAGLRSTVIGEHEVLGQVRRAQERADEQRTSGPVLEALFRGAVRTGRKVRAATAIATGTTSLSQVAVAASAEHLGGTLDGRRVVVVGAGEMGEGVARALVEGGGASESPDVTVVNRSPARARALAQAIGARAAAFGDLGAVLGEADAVIVTTGAGVPVLEPAVFPARPLVVVDLGVPRNVDPGARAVEGLVLLDMDDLRSHVARTMADRQATVDEATGIVRSEVERYHADARARGASPAVAALRARLEEIRLAELAKVRTRAEAEGATHDEQYWRDVDEASRAVLAKVLHPPTVALKETAGTPRGERLLEALRALFDF